MRQREERERKLIRNKEIQIEKDKQREKIQLDEIPEEKAVLRIPDPNCLHPGSRIPDPHQRIQVF
jgi:hypothetical protein